MSLLGWGEEESPKMMLNLLWKSYCNLHSPMITKWEIFYLVLMLCIIILICYLCPGLFQKMLPSDKILFEVEKGSEMDIGYIQGSY